MPFIQKGIVSIFMIRQAIKARCLNGVALASLMSALMVSAAGAHPKDMTLSTLHVAQEGLRIETVLPNAFVQSVMTSDSAQDFAEVVARGYQLHSESGPCPMVGTPRAWQLHDIDARRYVVDYACLESVPKELTLRYMLPSQGQPPDEAHENFMSVPILEQEGSLILSLTQNETVVPIARAAAESSLALPLKLNQTKIATPRPLDFLWLGAVHILSGLDHVLFLLALLLIGLSGTALLAVVSAFTVGHSVTLGISALGIYSPLAWVAESIIAASIIYLGLENLYALLRKDSNRTEQERRTLTRRRWAVAGLFGLVHGFGFSTVLRDMGLPEGAMVSSLLGFNLGVEIGQLLIVATLVPLLAWLWRLMGFRSVSISLSIVLLLLGSWWLVERTLFM